jgi:DNA-binding NarL/FixJ family response regulator
MKILLAESDPNILYGLNILSEQLENRIIMGQATNSQELLRCVCTSCPDVLLVSQVFPGLEDGILLETILQICPQLTILVLNVNTTEKNPTLSTSPSRGIVFVQKPEHLLEILMNYGRGRRHRDPEEIQERENSDE